MLDIKTMQYLDAVYKNKNFTKASHELHISQPAISEAIASLEKELGFVMMLRTPKKVTFTVEGEEFMRYVKTVLEDYNRTMVAVQELSDLNYATLHLGLSPTVGLPIFSLVYTEYMKMWPQVDVKIYEGPMLEQIGKLNDDFLEISYNALPEDDNFKNLTIMPLYSSEVYAVVPRDHPLAGRKQIDIKELDKQNVIMLNEDSKIRAIMLQAFEKNGVIPRIISSHYQVLAMLQMVKISNSIGFIDDSEDCSYVAQLKDEFILIPFAEPIRFPVGFIYKSNRHLSKAAKNLIALVKEHIKKTLSKK